MPRNPVTAIRKEITRYRRRRREPKPSPYSQFLIRSEIEALKESLRATMPDNPALRGYKVYSQFDEDGIIQDLLGRLPQESLTKTFIEIGAARGIENNTHFLLLLGYRGVWAEASEKGIEYIYQNVPALRSETGARRLSTRQRFVDRDNTAGLIDDACGFLGTDDVDVFSVDIDGNDLHVTVSALARFRPKLLVVEYNAKFPPPCELTVRYQPDHWWQSDDYQGASLMALCRALDGYVLVCCNLSGVNAFFVRNDLTDKFTLYEPSDLYQPARYELCELSNGHRATYKWLEQALSD